MRPRIILFIGFMISTLFACNNDDNNNDRSSVNGAYIGIFEREGVTSNVKLNLDNGSFTGESETVKFPAICKGSYSITNNSIVFVNECPWTAEFDWSLILSQEWNYVVDNNTLILIGSNGDKYTLTRQ